MKKPYAVGTKVKLTEEALENYGEEYRDRVFTVTHVSTNYMPSSEFYSSGCPDGYHPGYDSSLGGRPLYDFEELNLSLYDWEVKYSHTSHATPD